MAEKVNKAVALLKDTKEKAKAGGARLRYLAEDPDTQAKAKKLFEDGKKMYRAATSPEAKEAYRQAAEIIKKARKK
jgi:DNA-binding MurR/RpiR family transcriptional regulator